MYPRGTDKVHLWELGVHRTKRDTHFLDPTPGGKAGPTLAAFAVVFTQVCLLRYLLLCASVSAQKGKCCGNKGHTLCICPHHAVGLCQLPSAVPQATTWKFNSVPEALAWRLPVRVLGSPRVGSAPYAFSRHLQCADSRAGRQLTVCLLWP